MKLALARLRLFLAVAWREWEPRGCGIPEPYRARGRVGLREAWGVARRVWKHERRKQ